MDEQALMEAIRDNMLAVVAEAEDDEDAQERLAAYRDLLDDPEALADLAAKVGPPARLSISEEIRAKVRRLAEERRQSGQ